MKASQQGENEADYWQSLKRNGLDCGTSNEEWTKGVDKVR